MTLDELIYLPQGTPGLNLQAFDCGRESVNEFFREEAQDYQDELFVRLIIGFIPIILLMS